MTASSAQQSGSCSRINCASRSRIATRQAEDFNELALWMVPKKSARDLPLAPSTIATPQLRNEASIASTRMVSTLNKTESEKNAANCAENHAHHPVTFAFR